MKYTITIDQREFRCGDGCCSESWVEITIEDSDGDFLCTDFQTNSIHKDYDSENEILEYLSKQFGIELNSDNCVIV